MCTHQMTRSSYASGTITKADSYDVKEVAAHSAKVTEITKIANSEVARVGAHAVGTMADLVQGAGNVRRQLMDSGHRSEIYDDAHNKILQVTGQNLITMANAAQKEILQQAAGMMR